MIKEKNLHIEAMLVKMDFMKKNLEELSINHLDAKRLLDSINS